MHAMRKATRYAMSAALALTLGMLPLAGCGGGAEEPSSEAAAETAPEEKKAAEDTPAADEKEAGPVWIMSKQTSTYGTGEDTASIYVAYERDEHGNAISIKQGEVPAEGQESDDVIEYVEKYDLDEDGYVIATHVDGDDEEVTEEYELKKDDRGNLIERTASDGGAVMKQTFGEGNKLLTREVSYTYGVFDAENNPVESSYKATITYGDDGYAESVSIEDGVLRVVGEYEYERDAEGAVSKTIYREWVLDDEGNKDESTVREVTSTIERDENGNVKRTTTDEAGEKTIAEYEWVKIENPSVSARAEAALPVF